MVSYTVSFSSRKYPRSWIEIPVIFQILIIFLRFFFFFFLLPRGNRISNDLELPPDAASERHFYVFANKRCFLVIDELVFTITTELAMFQLGMFNAAQLGLILRVLKILWTDAKTMPYMHKYICSRFMN